MDKWNKGILKFVCLKCQKAIAQEDASIMSGESAVVFIYCKNCAKKMGMIK